MHLDLGGDCGEKVPLDIVLYNLLLFIFQKKGHVNLHVFEDWCGSTVDQLRKNLHFPLFPHVRRTLKKLAVAPQWKNYGLRIFGFLHPPEDGEYLFALAADDNAEFWLSSDEKPSDLKLLARIGTTGKEWTAPGEFGKYRSQVSNPRRLVASKMYYFEVLHKQDNKGTDHVEVAWKLNQYGLPFNIIDSQYLSLFVDESSFRMDEVQHIPQTVASHGKISHRSPPNKDHPSEMHIADPRDTFFKRPLIDDSRLYHILPSCAYMPSYLVKGYPLHRYQGLQFVRLSYVYPNDYTRLTHMESDNKCFYHMNSYAMKRYGFYHYMKMDIDEDYEEYPLLNKTDKYFYVSDTEEENEYVYEDEHKDKEQQAKKTEEGEEDEKEVHVKAEIQDDNGEGYQGDTQEKQQKDYGDDVDDYNMNRKRKLFSVDNYAEVPIIVPRRKKSSVKSLRVDPVNQTKSPQSDKPDFGEEFTTKSSVKVDGKGATSKQHTIKKKRKVHKQQSKMHIVHQEVTEQESMTQTAVLKVTVTSKMTTIHVPKEGEPPAFRSSLNGTAKSNITEHRRKKISKTKSLDFKLKMKDRDHESKTLETKLHKTVGISPEDQNLVTAYPMKEKLKLKKKAVSQDSEHNRFTNVKLHQTNSFSNGTVVTYGPVEETVTAEGDEVDNEEEELETLSHKALYDQAVNWGQTFSVENLDFHTLRNDWIDLSCNVSGNLLLREDEVLNLVDAFMNNLNDGSNGIYKLQQIVNVEKRADWLRGARYLLELELLENDKEVRLSRFVYALNKKRFRRKKAQDKLKKKERQLLSEKEPLLCWPSGLQWRRDVVVHIIVPVKNQARWVLQFISDMEDLYSATGDSNFNVIISDYNSTDMDIELALKRSFIPRYQYIRLAGNFERSAGLQAGIDLIMDDHSIIFLCDLHMYFPVNILENVRKHCVEGKMAFAPIIMRLNCGASPQEPDGFWEVNGFGLLGIYKSDLDAVGGMNTQEFHDRWGGEDWELLDRIFEAGLEVERLYMRNFYHHYHSRRGMWNRRMMKML
ncbi:beta-1,4-N-acetylgalactosaminyltransferase 3 [Protopterus annectens]|uniref:beta-1,4-N-acetylgalactosaminyltransferase 3 n=1 Tax=Protopterus annectens TaxID=7888 RepID=UPI001CFA3072|nr:beta-1,4-N-acetylgalactosaminyltransferase 3 [Protopterus annectens]